MNRSALIALVAILALPLGAEAQGDPAERIRAALERAAASGIPMSLLESRVAEGRAKGVAMERIAAAVERRGAALERAREAMRNAPGVTAADLAAGADAIEAGIDGRSLQPLISEARAEDRPVAIAVLTFLHTEQGLPVDQAAARVREALQRGPDALRNLPAQAAAQRGRGGPPAGVGGGRPAGVGGGRPGGVPAPGARPAGGRPENTGNPGRGRRGGGSGGL